MFTSFSTYSSVFGYTNESPSISIFLLNSIGEAPAESFSCIFLSASSCSTSLRSWYTLSTPALLNMILLKYPVILLNAGSNLKAAIANTDKVVIKYSEATPLNNFTATNPSNPQIHTVSINGLGIYDKV